ncbi:MAG: acetylhydrolase, partial [Planctomycetota bacterium]
MFQLSSRFGLTTLLIVSCLLIGVRPTTICAQEPANVRELRFEPIDATRSRKVPVKVYLVDSDEPLPIVLFSHGLGGSRENNSYLGRHWAAAGYVVVAMQHAGSDQDIWKSVRLGRRLAALKAAAGAKSLVDRLADVSFV